MRRLSYRGLGEPLSLIAFSLLSTVPAFTAIMRTSGVDLSAAALVAAHAPLLLPVALTGGLTTTAILFCSHFHQTRGDRAAGKMSPLVRLGTTRGCQVIVPATPTMALPACHDSTRSGVQRAQSFMLPSPQLHLFGRTPDKFIQKLRLSGCARRDSATTHRLAQPTARQLNTAS